MIGRKKETKELNRLYDRIAQSLLLYIAVKDNAFLVDEFISCFIAFSNARL